MYGYGIDKWIYPTKPLATISKEELYKCYKDGEKEYNMKVEEMYMLEKKFDEELKRYAELSFNECIDQLRHLYSRRDITEDEVKQLIDSIWILCQGADTDWTIDFGYRISGCHVKATKRGKYTE